MFLFLSALVVLFRDGTTALIAQQINTAAGQPSVAQVANAHAALLTSDDTGKALRSQIARALVIIDNNVRQSYEFPTAEQAEAETTRAERSEALRLLANAERQAETARAAAAALGEAEAAAKAARARLADLSAPKANASADGGTGEPPPSGGNGGGNPLLPIVPTIEEVIAAGYTPEVAEKIVARVQRERAEAEATLKEGQHPAASLLEYLAGLKPGESLDLLPKGEGPQRVADTVDISEPAPGAAPGTAPAKPEAEAPKPDTANTSAALPQAPAAVEAPGPASPDKSPAETKPPGENTPAATPPGGMDTSALNAELEKLAQPLDAAAAATRKSRAR